MIKILVVDDERDVQPLFEQRFRREIRSGELHFSFAFSGEEALDFLASQPSEAVLILSDINMPGMSGLELLRQIRQRFPAAAPPATSPATLPAATPPTVLMVTAYGDQETRDQAHALGASGVITKPVDFPQLKEKLHHLSTHPA